MVCNTYKQKRRTTNRRGFQEVILGLLLILVFGFNRMPQNADGEEKIGTGAHPCSIRA